MDRCISVSRIVVFKGIGACQSRVLYGENVVYNRYNVGRIVCKFSFSRWPYNHNIMGK